MLENYIKYFLSSQFSSKCQGGKSLAIFYERIAGDQVLPSRSVKKHVL